MSRDPEALRRALRSGPGLLGRTLGHPQVRAALDSASEELTAAPGAPTFESFDEGAEILVVGELAGVEAGQLRVYGYPAMIVVHVRGGGRHCVRLPRQVEPTSLSYAFRNGILSARARCAEVYESSSRNG